MNSFVYVLAKCHRKNDIRDVLRDILATRKIFRRMFWNPEINGPKFSVKQL